MKKIIKLTESDLRNLVKESVNKIINEILDDPYDYAKVKGLSAAAYEAANTPGADPKWAERKMRQSNAIKDRWRKLSNEYSKLEDNDSGVKWAMNGMDLHRVRQGMKDPKGYIRRNGYGNYLKGVTESDLHKIVKESVRKILKEGQEGYNQIMSVLNKPIWQEKLKKAWEKEKMMNPNPDWDTFEYNFALSCLDREREEDAKHYNKMRKIQRQLDNNTRKNV